jgi:uncharacterized pyridoxamine 5'-phosphate oxidase family protein
MKTVNDVHEFLTGKTFWIATADSDGTPHVRPFGAVCLYNNKVYITTNTNKNVSKQLKNNSKIEFAAMDEGMDWFRFIGTAQNASSNPEIKEQVIIENP